MRKVSRRDFLKFGFTSTALFGLGGSLSGCMSPPSGSSPKVRRTPDKAVTVASTCLLCPAGCGILGGVSGGRVTEITGNPKHPNSRGKMCARGHAGLNLLYDPDRLLYPFKRAGARGEGRWTRISWDQALEEISKRLIDLRGRSKSEALWVEMGSPGSKELLALHFFKSLGSPILFTDSGFPNQAGVTAHAHTWGAGSPVMDVARSRFILNFGANPYENHEQYISLAQRIVEAQVSTGAKLVTFDVRLSNTAGRSQEWFRVNPGTDGAIALAMAHHIFQQGLQDKEFLARWTNFPVSKLAEHLAQYTPEAAEKMSGIKAADIRRLALEFAQAKPAVCLTGRGISGHKNGVVNERCFALLNAVIGNIDIPGGCCLPRTMDLDVPQWKSPFSSSPQAFAALKEEKGQPEFFFAYMANPAYTNPGTAETIKVLKDEKRVPFLVVADTHLTETGALADLLLPMASYLESWNLETRPAMGLIPFVSIRQPMVSPLGKSKSLGDTLIELAGRMGNDFQKTLPYQSNEEFIEKAAARIEGLSRPGGLDLLKKEGVWFDPAAKPAYRSFEKRGFNTPSGKLEIFSRRLEEHGLPPLPAYVPIQAHQEMKGEDLILAVNRANVMTLSLANAKWLAEILHDNPLWINPETGRAKGLREGDRLKVSSATGSFIARVRFSEGVHPRAVTLTEGLGHSQLGRFARAKKEKSGDFDTMLIWWGQEGNGINTNELVTPDFEPASGGLAWNDTVVTLTRV